MSYWHLIDVAMWAWLLWDIRQANKDVNFWKDKYYELYLRDF
jgi:hypothetical protein